MEFEIKPLIQAEECYPAMERLALSADDTLHLAFRIFGPETPTFSQEAKERHLENWLDIIEYCLKRGVTIRLLLTDFEPVLANHLHRKSWRSARQIAEMSTHLPPQLRERLHIIVSLHEGELGLILRYGFWLPVRNRLNKILQKVSDEKSEIIKFSPGLWENIIHNVKGLRALVYPPKRIWPATHHQKFMVADGQKCILGGLDINERRYDDKDHNRPAPSTWHDVSVQAGKVISSQLEKHFAEVWKLDIERFCKVRERLASKKFGDPLTPLPLPENFEVPNNTEKGQLSARLIRTLSLKRIHPFSYLPLRKDHSIKDAYFDAVENAKNIIYLESQFFRYQPFADHVLKIMAEKPDLQIIILLPMAPEELAFEDNNGPEIIAGEWLQYKCLKTILDNYPERSGIFTLVRDAKKDPNLNDRATAYGSGIVYIHSKVLIVDDRIAIVGSANVNGRSFHMDTEVALEWKGEDVASFRRKLWNTHFRDYSFEDTENVLLAWRQRAQHNANTPPEMRKGFIVPFDMKPTYKTASFFHFVPRDYL
jgi:phosphatidylserine/phosphatidylglycerophosphate/cardiolipin synthase-like enzyme